jgi:hypothetical protein
MSSFSPLSLSSQNYSSAATADEASVGSQLNTSKRSGTLDTEGRMELPVKLLDPITDYLSSPVFGLLFFLKVIQLVMLAFQGNTYKKYPD